MKNKYKICPCGIGPDTHLHNQNRDAENKDWKWFYLILMKLHPDYDFKSDRINNAYSFLDSVAQDRVRAEAFLNAEPPSEIHPDRQRSAILHVKDAVDRIYRNKK